MIESVKNKSVKTLNQSAIEAFIPDEIRNSFKYYLLKDFFNLKSTTKVPKGITEATMT